MPKFEKKYTALRKPNVGLMHIAVFFLIFQTLFDRHFRTSYANNIIPTRKASTPSPQKKESENTKEATRNHKLKDKQYNRQNKKDKKKNNK